MVPAAKSRFEDCENQNLVPPSLSEVRECLLIRFTRREQQVAELMAAGMTRREISSQLRISVHTVRCHAHNARKRAIKQQPALARYAAAMQQTKKIRFKPFSLLTTDHI